jgi:hypothetical protein
MRHPLGRIESLLFAEDTAQVVIAIAIPASAAASAVRDFALLWTLTHERIVGRIGFM